MPSTATPVTLYPIAGLPLFEPGDDVAAIIAPGLGGDALLGMSFLARMDVRLYQGTMTITQVEE